MSFNLDEIAKLLDAPKKVEYRVYYDCNKNCTRKSTVVVGTDGDDSDYIVVDADTYNNIELCGNYRVKDNKLVLIPKPTTASIMLERAANGPWRTVKNNMMIAVGPDYADETDTWDVKHEQRNS